MTSLVTASNSDEESVDSGEDSDTWNWRNAENNRLIIQLYKYDKEQDKRLDKLEQRLNGIVSLLGINEVPVLYGDDHDQLINDNNEHLNQPESEQPNLPMGGGRTRRKKRTRKRRKKKTKKRRKKRNRKKRTKRRK